MMKAQQPPNVDESHCDSQRTAQIESCHGPARHRKLTPIDKQPPELQKLVVSLLDAGKVASAVARTGLFVRQAR